MISVRVGDMKEGDNEILQNIIILNRLERRTIAPYMIYRSNCERAEIP
jgi:hypothetical protein